MVASNTAWDLTGRQAGTQQYLPTGQKTGTSESTGGGNTSVTETATQFQTVNKQNTPDFALNNLEDLINQLMDRPNLSDQEANAKFPLPERVFDKRGGWGFRLPNGTVIFGPTANAVAKDWEARQLASREKAQRESGMTAGGTLASKESSAQRSSEIQRNREQQGKYSKEAAFADAAALSGKFSRQLLEQVMPQISKAIEASGTSGGAVGGLLAQDAAARVAEAQASLGLQASTQYGQISNQLAAILADLAKSQDPAMQALLQALGLAKGTIELGSASSTGTSTKTGTSTEQKTVDTSEAQTGNPLLQQLMAGLRTGVDVSVPNVAAPSSPTPTIANTNLDLEKILGQRQQYGAGYAF